MAYLLSVATIDKHDRRIKIVHQFYGFTESEVERYRQAHLAEDAGLRAAEAEELTVSYLEDVPGRDLPTVEDFEDAEEEEEEEV